MSVNKKKLIKAIIWKGIYISYEKGVDVVAIALTIRRDNVERRIVILTSRS